MGIFVKYSWTKRSGPKSLFCNFAHLVTECNTFLQGYNTAKWAAVWGQYRNCTGKPKIIHKNGSGLDLDLVSETMSNSSYKINRIVL